MGDAARGGHDLDLVALLEVLQAEVRLIHPQLTLHHLRRQTDLATHDPPTRSQPPLGLELLHAIRRIDPAIGYTCTMTEEDAS